MLENRSLGRWCGAESENATDRRSVTRRYSSAGQTQQSSGSQALASAAVHAEQISRLPVPDAAGVPTTKCPYYERVATLIATSRSVSPPGRLHAREEVRTDSAWAPQKRRKMQREPGLALAAAII